MFRLVLVFTCAYIQTCVHPHAVLVLGRWELYSWRLFYLFIFEISPFSILSLSFSVTLRGIGDMS